MPDALIEWRILCPYCGEPVETVVDVSAGEQRYIEDCPVCCRPMELAITIGSDGSPSLSAARDDD